tara:strand:- start:3112 stop:3939 length:828 start_codon:yes stop_codon:yes gene_type:complete
VRAFNYRSWSKKISRLLSIFTIASAATFTIACDTGPSLHDLTKTEAANGVALAQYHMGLMTLHGNGMEQSATQAVDWFRKAAEQELPDAQYSLARALLSGEGVKKDLLEAEKWYRAASANGIVEAHYRLAKMLLQDGREEEGLSYFNLAANKGHLEAQYELGVMNFFGRGTSETYVSGNKAQADRGDLDAQYRSELIENYGNLVPCDYISAYVWFELASSVLDKAAKLQKEMVLYQTPTGEFLIDRFGILEGKNRATAWLKENSDVTYWLKETME